MDPIKRFRQYAGYLCLPAEVRSRVVTWLKHQIQSRGLIGCHNKLKDTCTQLRYWLRAKADGRRCELRAPWVAITAGGFPKLFSGLQEMQNETLEILTKLYKVFQPSRVSDLPVKDLRNAFNNVTADYSGTHGALTDALALIQQGARLLPNRQFDDYAVDSGTIYDPNHELLPKGIEWSHAFYQRNKAVLQPLDVAQCFYPFNATREPDVWSGDFESLNRDGNVFSFSDPSFTVMGEYQMSAKPGFKSRAFFSPVPPVQAASEPLFRFLENLEKTCGYSVRYLQTEAKVSKVQQWLSEGSVVSSIDQTAATDRFPLRLQLFLAHCLSVPKEYIRFIKWVSQGDWIVDDQLSDVLGRDRIRLSVGQPMGVSFSMPLYTLSMIALLLGACQRWGYSPDFLVLGDDLVVRDEALAKWCYDFLPRIGVGISKTKGITSCNVAELAGATILKDSYVFPGEYPEIDQKSWYMCSVRLAQPLPDGCPKVSSTEKLKKVFWMSRVAALGCYGKISCPIENGISCLSIIQRLGFTEVDLDRLVDDHLQYDIRRIRDSARSLAGSIRKGRITSKSDAIRRILTGFVENNQLESVLEREDKLLRRGFTQSLSRVAYGLFDAIGTSSAVGFETWLKPRGDTTNEWTAHTLIRVSDILKLDAPNWPIRRTRLDQRLMLLSILEVVDLLREMLWERRTQNFKRENRQQSSFCHYLCSL